MANTANTIRKVKDAKDLKTNELIYLKGHAGATYMSDGRTVEDAINGIQSVDVSNKLDKTEAANTYATKSELDNIVIAHKFISHGIGDTTFTLTPNVYHVWDVVESLTITYGSEGDVYANQYMFQFTSGSTATTLSLPDTIKWANDSVLEIEANKTYSISIINNLAVYAVFTN